jgi:molybdate transport system ATP-binding protein
MRLTAGQLVAGDAVAVVFPPSAVAVFRSAPGHGSPRNVWTAVVQAIEPGPTAVRLRTGTALAVSADVTPAAVAELGIAGGEQVWLAVKATEVRVYRR